MCHRPVIAKLVHEGIQHGWGTMSINTVVAILLRNEIHKTKHQLFDSLFISGWASPRVPKTPLSRIFRKIGKNTSTTTPNHSSQSCGTIVQATKLFHPAMLPLLTMPDPLHLAASHSGASSSQKPSQTWHHASFPLAQPCGRAIPHTGGWWAHIVIYTEEMRELDMGKWNEEMWRWQKGAIKAQG